MSKRFNHEWEYPICPECDNNIFVVSKHHVIGRDEPTRTRDYFKCEKCETEFGERVFETDREGDHTDEEWLRNQYVVVGRTRREIADMCDVKLSSVKYHLKKYGIKKSDDNS